MSTEAIGAAAPDAVIDMDTDQPAASLSSSSSNSNSTSTSTLKNPRPVGLGLHSPPDSNNAMNLDGSDSELSDIDEVADKLNGIVKGELPPPSVEVHAELEEEEEVEVEDIGEVLPDHFSGTVPVFKPTMKQFKDFKLFYGMKSGIVKIIPPQEWKDSLPRLDDLVKPIRVREPIKQEIMGSNGTYRQVNILHQRSYNMPQWRQLCDQSEHQPPARRGERRANAEKHKPVTRARAAASSSTTKQPPTPATGRRKGRVTRGSARAAKEEVAEPEARPITPVSPAPEEEKIIESVEQDPGVKEEDECDDEDDVPVVRRMGGIARQAKPKVQSTSARRKYIRREGSAMIDEAAFRDWDYQMDVSDYTPERCEELERIYWKTLTYAPPLYGADLPGTLFGESTEIWNLNKLPNLLDVLGTKVPGVNTAYLYLGMWKATFAWHLEDVDLYSINYLHFGAPKQWYSISQADARRFEAAMKNIWPTEAKACDQFLRHKAFLISPAHLKQNYNITVNKCVSYPGEFVVTYPYGYHSGYNLGYNCAEAVNFALDSWLPMGKIAKKCQCAEAQDSVWVDVYEIERKLRGESTEYEETEDEEDEDDEDQETGLPSPPSSHAVKAKVAGRKRKRAGDGNEAKAKTKKIRLRLKPYVEPPCCLCPNDIPGAEIMSTDDGRKAHRMCALYLPETFIETVDDVEIIANVAGIDKARMDLKCLYCRSKKGACFQCSQKKCPRSYHATCAAAAGVFVEEAEVPFIGEDGTEYKEQAFEFSCRFHRTKRDRKFDGDALADNPEIREAAAALKKHDICQMQFFRGDIFAGVVMENRPDEEMLLVNIVPHGYVPTLAQSGDRQMLTKSSDIVEVEWKWLLLPDPADLRLPKASANAIPMPTSRKAKQEINAKRPVDELPRKDDEFAAGFTWAEFHTGDPAANRQQVKIDLFKENRVWHYLGKTSTEAKAQYTEDLKKPQHNLKSNFLDSIPKPISVTPIPPPQPKRSYSATHPSQVSKPKPKPKPAAFPATYAGGFTVSTPGASHTPLAPKHDRPYIYKPRKPNEPAFGAQYTLHTFMPNPPAQASPQGQQHWHHYHQHQHQPQPQLQQQQQPQLQPQQQQQPQPQPQPQQQGQGQRQGQQPLPLRMEARQPPPTSQPQPVFEVKQHQPSGTDAGRKGLSTHNSSDRFAPVGGSNGFLQLPGLTWPPAHMKSGHYSQPQSRVWPLSKDAAPPRPPPMPMTSSSLKLQNLVHPQAGAAGVQPEVSAYQKYSFFQVHHNSARLTRSRDTSRYRTPYGQWGGFTNGYEGNLRAFLIKAQHALSGSKGQIKGIPASLLQPLQPRIEASPPVMNHSPSPRYGSPYSQNGSRMDAPSPQSMFFFDSSTGPLSSPTSMFLNPHQDPSTPGSSSWDWDMGQPASAPLHPAIRPQYGTTPWHQQSPEVQMQGQSQPSPVAWSGSPQALIRPPAPQPQPSPPQPPHPSQQPQPSQPLQPSQAIPPPTPPVHTPALVRAPAYAKQSHSPIPLPPYVKQAIMSSPATSGPKPSPLSRPPQQATSHSSGLATVSTPSVPRQPQSQTLSAKNAVPNRPPVDAKSPTAVTQASAAHIYTAHPQDQDQNNQYHNSWTPPSEEGGSSPGAEASAAAAATSMQQLPTYHYQQGGIYMQANTAGSGSSEAYFAPAPASSKADMPVVPAESQALVEKLMLNLKRASEMETPAA
ncbi:hypothetical protein B0T22DRAFT_384051 [Podospora appendiculata]|uniref:[histone H3]-trimethyl-L-lysine(9) demethylase n=1 Tax=Podospora appendiculata TaxID=314037 RepID=A0AAE0X274_9PEZI|nr:hypothetical protein B0T22DRAFT_384051 [Podospora appendiculata]